MMGNSMATYSPRVLNRPCENKLYMQGTKRQNTENCRKLEKGEGNMCYGDPGASRGHGAAGGGQGCVKRRSGGAKDGCDQEGRSTHQADDQVALHPHYRAVRWRGNLASTVNVQLPSCRCR